MSEVRLTILGAGSVRCSPPVLATLANHFGERPLEIRMYDADEERLDLFDLLARSFFTAMKSTHRLISTTDPVEALEEANLVVLQVDENCAKRYLRTRGLEIGTTRLEALDALIGLVPETSSVLHLAEEPWVAGRLSVENTDWPGPVPDDNPVGMALESLRYVRGEESVFPFIHRHARNPFRSWLERQEAVVGR